MNFYYDPVGFIHLVSAIIAMITGTIILAMKKGAPNHKRVGYVYVSAMTVMLITSFMIYRLWGEWGLFHFVAVISSVTILGGFIPIIIKYPKDSYIVYHFSLMYWSVIGLYGAFFSEIITRLPNILYEDTEPGPMFFILLSITTFVVMMTGGIYFYRNKDRWKEQFSNVPD